MTAPTRPTVDDIPGIPVPPPQPKADDNRWLHAATRRIQDAA